MSYILKKGGSSAVEQKKSKTELLQEKTLQEIEEEEAKDNRQFYDRGWFWGFIAIIAFVYLWFKYMV